MAQRIITELVDDLDGKEAAETVRFGLDGANYEIDLSDKHAEKLRQALALYVGHARNVTTSKTRTTGRATGNDASQVRVWARDNGYDVPDRGRIPSEIRAAYAAAH